MAKCKTECYKRGYIQIINWTDGIATFIFPTPSQITVYDFDTALALQPCTLAWKGPTLSYRHCSLTDVHFMHRGKKKHPNTSQQ
jgi:hypothetical protein